MKRAFLFGLTAMLLVVGVVFLVLDEQMLPMTRSPLIGAVALALAIAAGFFAWTSPPHPSLLTRIGMWILGFVALFAAIPVIEIVVVMFIAATN